MSTQIKYAYKRHNTWIYRRTYPVHLQEILGSSLKRSLHTAEAIRIVNCGGRRLHVQTNNKVRRTIVRN